jgi:hypothetical protein
MRNQNEPRIMIYAISFFVLAAGAAGALAIVKNRKADTNYGPLSGVIGGIAPF